jgi:hypothetical protein
VGFFGLFGRRKRSKHVQDELDKITVEEKRERIEDRRTSRELVLEAVKQNRPELADAAAVLRPSRGRPPLRIGSAGGGMNDRLMEIAFARLLEDPEDRAERMQLAAIRHKKAMRELLDEDYEEEDRGPKGILRELMPLAPILALPFLANNPAMAQAAAPLIAGMLGGGQQQADPEPAPQPAPQMVVQQVQHQAMPAPQPVAEPIDTDDEPLIDTPADQEASSNVLSGLKPRIVLANLERMDATTFASWLLHQPQSEVVVTMLCNVDTNDPQAVLSQMEANPLTKMLGWSPVLSWLKVHEVQAISIIESLRTITRQGTGQDPTPLEYDAGI